MAVVDARRDSLQSWAVEWLARERPAQVPAGNLLTVSGDASFRRYFRLPVAEDAQVSQGVAALIAVDAPPEKEDSRPFVAIARALHAHGVRVPAILTVDFEQGFMLLEDFGDVLLRTQLTDDSANVLYGKAMQTLRHMLRCEAVHGYALPPYDRQRLLDEMALLRDWFIARYLELSLTADQHAVLSNAFSLIADDVLQQPQVFVHRDYHSRNLMVLPDADIGVIDFQDAVTGPISYDLVSLLRDAYVSWPEAQVQQWVGQFAELLRADGLITVDNTEFLRWFDWMGAQRHLKVVGIFARLSLRDGKHGYLDDIPLVFNYLLAEIRDYPELSALFDLLRSVVLPAYLQRRPELSARLEHWIA